MVPKRGGSYINKQYIKFVKNKGKRASEEVIYSSEIKYNYWVIRNVMQNFKSNINNGISNIMKK